MKILRWYPLLFGSSMMVLFGEIVSAINGHYYSYYPFPSSIPVRDALFGMLVGALTIVWRRDRFRQRSRRMLVLIFVCSFLDCTICDLLAFLAHASVDLMVGDLLETSMSALLTGFFLDQMWKWYLKAECLWTLGEFFRGSVTIVPYPAMHKLTCLISCLVIFLSSFLISLSGITPDLFAPRAIVVTITLVPQMISNGIDVDLTLPINALVEHEVLSNSNPDEIRTTIQKEQDALHQQERQQTLGVIDGSLHCTSSQQKGVTVQCQELVYSFANASLRAVSKFRQSSLPTNLNGYQEVGPAMVHVARAQLSIKGTVLLHVAVYDFWAYVFSSTRLHQLAHLLAGKWEDDAYALLQSQTGLEKAWLSTAGQSLPTDPKHIHFQITRDAL